MITIIMITVFSQVNYHQYYNIYRCWWFRTANVRTEWILSVEQKLHHFIFVFTTINRIILLVMYVLSYFVCHCLSLRLFSFGHCESPTSVNVVILMVVHLGKNSDHYNCNHNVVSHVLSEYLEDRYLCPQTKHMLRKHIGTT
jgi:hypothetical protein